MQGDLEIAPPSGGAPLRILCLFVAKLHPVNEFKHGEMRSK